MQQRDYRIDAIRCLMMLGICLLHALNQTDQAHWRYASMLYFCVDGFVFISGWFGITFRISKVLRLCGVALWCATCVCIADFLKGGGSETGVIRGIFETYCRYWFLHAYIFLMLIAPLIDCALEKATRRELVPFFLLVFGWSFLANFKESFPLLPTTSGLGASTGLSLLGVYVVARICRKQEILEKLTISTPLLVVGVIGLFLLGLTKYNLYNNPITVLLTIGVFALSLRIKWSAPSVFAFLTPSLFSVYLLHTSRFVFPKIPGWIDFFQWAGPFKFLTLAFLIFWCCIAVDLIRRLLIHLAIHLVLGTKGDVGNEKP